MKTAKIRVFRRMWLQRQQPSCVCQQAQASSYRPLLAPMLVRLQLYVCDPFAFKFNPLCTEGSQAHQEEPCVEAAAVDPAPEGFCLNLHASFGQQLRKLADVQRSLGDCVLQELTRHCLPQVVRIFGGHFHSRINFFQAASLLEYVACLQHLFHRTACLSVAVRVTKMSPFGDSNLYFVPEAISSRSRHTRGRKARAYST